MKNDPVIGPVIDDVKMIYKKISGTSKAENIN